MRRAFSDSVRWFGMTDRSRWRAPLPQRIGGASSQKPEFRRSELASTGSFHSAIASQGEKHEGAGLLTLVLHQSSLAVGSLSATRVWSDQVRSGSGGEQAMAEQKTEKESPEQRKPDAPQLQKHEIDFEALVIAGIAAVIMKSPKRRTKPWSNPSR